TATLSRRGSGAAIGRGLSLGTCGGGVDGVDVPHATTTTRTTNLFTMTPSRAYLIPCRAWNVGKRRYTPGGFEPPRAPRGPHEVRAPALGLEVAPRTPMVELPAARLVEEHAQLPRRAAAIVYRRVKDHMEYDELVALGNVGLVEAAARYEGGRGASFATYAWY